MRILDEQGNEITNPDLAKGRIEVETIVIAHHPSQPETSAEYETVEIEPGLFERREKTPWQPARGAWDEVETIGRYIPYTAEELAAIEQAKKDEEEAAKRAEEEVKAEAERQAALNALPARVDDIEEAMAEVGVMTADNTVSMEDLMEAVAELGVMIAEMQEA